MFYCCDHCHYVFSAEALPEQCPDCGEQSVRRANDGEVMEYNLIKRLGGIDAINTRIRELAKPIAARKSKSVDELLNTVCCIDPLGNETTYGELYRLTFLEGAEESIFGE